MKLEGSCYCKKVKFSVDSTTPQPFMRCYCSICRKTAGTGGYAINIMGSYESLKIEGKEHMKMFAATSNKRYFCGECGTALYCHCDDYAEWVYPHAGAIDTPLPAPAETLHIMLDSKVEVPPADAKNLHFKEYPDIGIMDWHKKHNLVAK